MSGKFTPSIEDYLECIYQINLGQGVKSTDIAAKLSVSKPSVHRAIVTLAEMGLLSQEKYSLIYLTEAGQKKAAEVSEKHEILSGFLQDVLGIAPDVAEEEACKMEHGVSMETVQKFNALRKKLSEKLDLETLWEKSE
jgi:DtxR family Mn-dependent transcriptional regulator